MMNNISKNKFSGYILTSADTVKLSIVVAAKNEAANINSLINSIKNNDYSFENFELIIIDDKSTDETFQVAEKALRAFSNFNIYKVKEKKHKGKRGALDYGIRLAANPYILITDADCKPGKNWLKAMADKFLSGCDFVIGVAPFIQRNKLINKIACYENFKNSLLAFTAARMGLPYTASARNFGFRKDAFVSIGGFSNTTQSISGDDDLLLREAIKNNLNICTLRSQNAFVYSETKNSFKEYFRQRARHTQASFYYTLKQKLFLAIWHFLNLLFFFSPVLLFVNKAFIIPFIVKILFDAAIAVRFQSKFGYKFKLIDIAYLQFFYEIFLIIHFFNAKFSKVKWK